MLKKKMIKMKKKKKKMSNQLSILLLKIKNLVKVGQLGSVKLIRMSLKTLTLVTSN